MYRFLHLFNKNSGVTLQPCYRYSTEKCGGKVVATKAWYATSFSNATILIESIDLF